MKTNYFLIAFCCLLFAFGFVACENDKQDDSKKGNVDVLENPYNYVGKNHNVWLDSLSLHINEYELLHQTDLSDSIALLIKISSDYMFNKGFDTIGVGKNTSDILANIKNCYMSVVDTLSLSSHSKQELRRLLNFVLERQVSSQNNSSNSIISVIKDEENRIMTNQYSIPNEEKSVILSVTATMKSSIVYWDSYVQMSSKDKGTIVALADAIGALGGHTMSVIASKAAERRLKKVVDFALVGSINDGFAVRF